MALDDGGDYAYPEIRDEHFVPIAEFMLRLRTMGITDRRLVAAFESVPRALFVPPEARDRPAFSERPIPIDCGQGSTPPHIAAKMLVALGATERCRVLEIGTGTGYLSAVLSRLCRRVYTIDRFRTLVRAAQTRFETLRIGNVTGMFGDGLLGWVEKAPFDRIIVSGAGEFVPASLTQQLKPGGVLVMPIGPEEGVQILTRFERADDGLIGTPVAEVRMVPLIPGQAERL